VSGPKVFLDYDQEALNAAFDQIAYAPNQPQVALRNVANSDAVRARIGQPERYAYGPSAVEHLDFYRSRSPRAPIFVFVHGGAWRATGIERYGFAAESFVGAGAHFVLPQFTGVEEAGGSLLVMAAQVRSAVAWVYRHAADFGGDPERIYVGGHSSGAHLTGVVTITDWSAFGVPSTIVKGALCCSGMYDLVPASLSNRSSYVSFDAETIEQLSTMRHIDRIRIPLVVAYGTCETPEFQRQNRTFAAELEAAGKPVQLLVGAGYNHFELIETLGNPYGLVGRAALDLMQLAPAAAA
jgi:arylformamidase